MSSHSGNEDGRGRDEAHWQRIREEFHLPPSQIYLDGNSLGLLNRRAEAAIVRVMAEWSAGGIAGWTDHGWIDLAERTAAGVAPLVGASPASVTVTGQTTTNLHQLLATLFDPIHPTRRVILADELNFASDAHALSSHLRLRGLDPAEHLRWVCSRDGYTLDETDIETALAADDVQLALLPSVLFESGQLLNIGRITRFAREHDVMIGWDLSHSVGALPHDLEAQGADFAVWCHYKYLNAGPGAAGGLFLHPHHHERPPGLAGWWGVRADRRFRLETDHVPATGAQRLHIGTPPILSVAPLAGSLELLTEAGGIDAVRARSLALTDHLMARFDADLADLGFSLVTPRAPDRRGGHLALVHPAAGQICPALRLAGVTPDFRHPAVLRLAPCALYNSFQEIDLAVDRLIDVVRTRAYDAFPAVDTAAP